MGSPKKLRKKYERPKRLWDKSRIEEEGGYVSEYGLKNMKELWRAETVLRGIRREARKQLALHGANERRVQELLNRVKRYFIRNNIVNLDDLLSLSVRDILERRLQTIVFKKGLAKTIKQARQFVVHGHIAINGNKVTSPSYTVPFSEEDNVAWYGTPISIEPVSEGTPTERSEVEKKRSKEEASESAEKKKEGSEKKAPEKQMPKHQKGRGADNT